MKKFLILLITLIVIIGTSACGADTKDDPNMIKVSRSSSDMVGENYQSVISVLKSIGYTDITTVPIEDLILGILTKDGEIEQVAINGKTEFSENSRFAKDAKIVITYHTFPKTETSSSVTNNKESSVSSAISGTGSTVSSNKENSASSATNNEEILTAANNAELAAVLKVKNNYDPIISAFAKKYAGRTIEFAGNIAYMTLHGNYKTRYDILIYAGDYNEKYGGPGPSFKFENVNIVNDLNLTGSNIPDTIKQGQNIQITAKVVEFNEGQALFFLKPISTQIR